MTLNWNIILLMLAILFNCTSQSLTFRVVAQDKIEESTETTLTPHRNQAAYRQTVAKVKDTTVYRVPEHLQFIPKGFVYEDAEDVIHVIDPPKHFEELKKVMQRQGQQPMLSQRPIALRQHRPKPKIIKSHLQVSSLREEPLKRPLKDKDLESQESQPLPVEILASVRKTEKYLEKFKPKLPLVKQRLKTKKIQTVIWENKQDQQQYQHGQELRAQGERVREQTMPQRRRYMSNKRIKRAVVNANVPLKGEELLKHINELIKNATFYLQQAEKYEDFRELTSREATTTATTATTATLKGEILINPPEISTTPAATLNDDMMVKILENSVKATNVIMQQIKAQTNLSNISEKCDYLKVTYPNHIQNLQSQIKCMQNFIKDINETQKLMSATKSYGERLDRRKTKDLRHKPFLVAQLGDEHIEDITASPINRTLIYDDVMTTIRNMLQSQNLQTLDEPAIVIGKSSWYDDSPYAYDKSDESVDFHNLQEYLVSLHSIVEDLPKFSHKSLNLLEIEGGSTSKYYFINPQGTIYSLPQPFQKDFTTSAAPSNIFRQFPDLPIVTEYFRNGTLLPSSRQVVEIL